MAVRLLAGDVCLTVDAEAGGRASSIVVGGLELLGADGPGPRSYGMYPMAPWVGRLHDNTVVHAGASYVLPATHEGWAMHGTVVDRPWTVLRHEPGNVGAAVALVELAVELADPWPWPGTVRQRWRLTPAGLDCSLEVSSDAQEFPADVGWHPWFRRRLARGEPVEVDLPAESMLERGPDHLPTGRLLAPVPPGPYDDTFPLPGGRFVLRWPGALRLSCTTDCAYVVRFDERPGLVCLEPQSGPPDGVNTHPVLVAPGRPLVAGSTWRWERD